MSKTRTSTQRPSKRRIASRAATARTPKIVSAKVEPAKPAPNRAERAAERREAIIAAAMDEFIAQGFAAARLDDVAKRAGVAKGTIYLHFKDKEALFEELIRTAIVPLVNRLAMGPPPSGASVRDMIEGFARTFIHEVTTTQRGDIVRLIVAEGPRFPAVADFYYREVVSKGLAGMRAAIQIGIARGEIKNKELAQFPQILIAPAMIAVIWQSLFARHAPLDANEMFRVHLDLIFGERRTT
jgi:AcrR family transcriptional regulator